MNTYLLLLQYNKLNVGTYRQYFIIKYPINYIYNIEYGVWRMLFTVYYILT